MNHIEKRKEIIKEITDHFEKKIEDKFGWDIASLQHSFEDIKKAQEEVLKINSEKFLDEIIERINRKQIK